MSDKLFGAEIRAAKKENAQNELAHHGILGMKWGERRFQNEDGSLTPEGRERYHKKSIAKLEKVSKAYSKAMNGKYPYVPKTLSENAYKELSKDKEFDEWADSKKEITSKIEEAKTKLYKEYNDNLASKLAERYRNDPNDSFDNDPDLLEWERKYQNEVIKPLRELAKEYSGSDDKIINKVVSNAITLNYLLKETPQNE